MQQEVWKVLADFPLYEVSTFGRVRRGFSFIKPVAVQSGKKRPRATYFVYRVSLSVGGVVTHRSVARLVITAFGPPKPSSKHLCRHVNGDPSDNKISNLMWGTNRDNSLDMVRHGKSCKGSKNGNSKIKEQDVAAIKALYVKKSSECGLASLASRFGISVSAVHCIVTEKVWTHVKPRYPKSRH